MAEPVTRAEHPRVAGSARLPRFLRPAATVSVAFLVANALAYVFTVLATRTLAPAAYGELAALLGVLLVGTVPATGLQTAAALHLGSRAAAEDAAGRHVVVARLNGAALAVGLGVCTAGALAAVPLMALLHLPDAAAVSWLVALLLPHTLFSGYQGVLQGLGGYRRLAAVSILCGAGKLAGGALGLAVGATPAAALAGMTVGTSVGAVGGWLACGRPAVAAGLREPALAALRASGPLLGFVVLLNLDLLLARHHLPAGAAGDYAVATIVAKVAFWLPQGVGIVLLPRLGDAGSRRHLMPRGIALVAAVGGLLVLGTAALGDSALSLVGGAAYGRAPSGWTWCFAVLGTLLAVVQVLLYSGIATADRVAAPAVWTGVAAETAVVGLLATADRLSPVSLVATATTVAAALAGLGLLRMRRDVTRSGGASAGRARQ